MLRGKFGMMWFVDFSLQRKHLAPLQILAPLAMFLLYPQRFEKRAQGEEVFTFYSLGRLKTVASVLLHI